MAEFEQLWVEDPPAKVARKAQILAAVLQNQVGTLESLLDSPEWYNVRNKLGYNILQIAILRDRLEVFNYLLSLSDFPLEYATEEGKTALVVALTCIRLVRHKEHYSFRLLKKGACAKVVCSNDKTLLHCAVQASYNRVAKLLIERGADLTGHNENGESVLEVVARYFYLGLEPMLLMYGAPPTVRAFVNCVTTNKPLEIQENLFLYTFDEYFDEEIPLGFILKLGAMQSPFFHELIKYRVDFEEDCKYNVSETCLESLCAMSLEYLKIIIEKFSSQLKQLLTTVNYLLFVDIENLNVMIESGLRPEIIFLLNAVSYKGGNKRIIKSTDESAFTEFYCFCLSYGLNITEANLQRVYMKFGFCELFRILLYMDIHMIPGLGFPKNIAVALFYDMNLDLEQIVQHELPFLMAESRLLVTYFVHSRLREEYLKYVDEGTIKGGKNLPQVPLLVELARNQFRKFFIKKLQIKTSTRFYTLVKNLSLSIDCKRILTFEQRLY